MAPSSRFPRFAGPWFLLPTPRGVRLTGQPGDATARGSRESLGQPHSEGSPSDVPPFVPDHPHSPGESIHRTNCVGVLLKAAPDTVKGCLGLAIVRVFKLTDGTSAARTA